MNIEDFRTYCMNKKGVTEELPFDDQILVFKVLGKMFALTNIETFESINLKCNPDKAEELRAAYDEITPGYHMNKKHWNTIRMDGSLDDDFVFQWLDHSYDLVVHGMSKKAQKMLSEM